MTTLGLCSRMPRAPLSRFAQVFSTRPSGMSRAWRKPAFRILAASAASRARILKAGFRQALDIPDGRVENTWANRLKVARVIREQRPRVVILPYWQGRHPDHYTCSTLGYEACFLAGLSKLQLEQSAPSDALKAAPPS